jgi:hypothetical protein
MKTIVLEVDEALAKAWNNRNPSLRMIYKAKIIALQKEFQTELSGEKMICRRMTLEGNTSLFEIRYSVFDII